MRTSSAITIRVASIPARHPYVDHLSVPGGTEPASGSATILRIDGPVPDPAEPERWWPPVMLDAAWVRAHADEFDLLHLHFGFESFSTGHLLEWIDALHEAGKPLVFTVHDLTNPQLGDQASHRANLDVLVPRADALITLTAAAAGEIAERWGREAVVIAHPNVVALDAAATDLATAESVVVGVHLRDLRPNIDGVAATRALVDAVGMLRADGVDIVARVDLNARVRDDDARAAIRELCDSSPHAELREHDRYDDGQLESSVAALDVVLLPYRHGTHSGWVELCWDLGVPVVGTAVGHSDAQHDDPGFFTAYDGGADSLASALRSLLALPGFARSATLAREAIRLRRRLDRGIQRLVIAEAHEELYRRAVEAARPRPLRIAVIAPLRYPISVPFAGGLESSVWHQVAALRALGHEVVLCATEGSDYLEGSPPEFVLPAVEWREGEYATDTTYPAGYLERALPALEGALAWIAANPDRFDIVDNNSLHGEPLSWASRVGVPMVSTLHTPVLPALLAAHTGGGSPRSNFLAVSEHTAAEWRAAGIVSEVIPNAVDTDRWALGEGGPDLVWFGRIVPEKGVHLALEAARLAGMRIVLAGRIGDVGYFAEQVEPLLGPDAEYVGALDPASLARLVGASACALVTPVWEEPFGLVIAEAMSTGTPVVVFDSGGVREVVGSSPGTELVPAGDAAALAAAALRMVEAVASDHALRNRIRETAVSRFSLAARARSVESLYRAMIG
jgi:glycosyltransferase involved in cell wall biosynthesis